MVFEYQERLAFDRITAVKMIAIRNPVIANKATANVIHK